MGETTTLRIGLIGAGYIGAKHAEALTRLDGARVVAVADVDLRRARAVSATCQATAYDDHRRLLEAESVDAVFICVPPFAHGEVEAAVIERRLPFFVEKPLSVDLSTAEAVAGAVVDQGLITAVGYHWRYLDTVEATSELLATSPAHLAVGYWLDCTAPPAWWVRRGLSGGQIVEQATHILDLARLLMGEVVRVEAWGTHVARMAYPGADIDTVSTAMLGFSSGALGLLASTCLLTRTHRTGLHLFGEDFAIEVGEHETLLDRGGTRQVRATGVDPFLREDRDFLDAVRGLEDRVRVPYDEALRTHRLALAVAAACSEDVELGA